MASTHESVVEAWEKKLGTSGEFRVEEVTDVSGETVYHLISRNGSVTAASRSLEKLEAHAGEPFVEALADTDFPVAPVEIDNKDAKKAWNQQSVVTRDQVNEVTPDEPTKEEAERLRRDGGFVVSGNDSAGEFSPQDNTAGQEVRDELEQEALDRADENTQNGEDEQEDGSLTHADERVEQ